MRGNEGWSAEDLALLAAALILIGDLLSFWSLLKEREEKSNKTKNTK